MMAMDLGKARKILSQTFLDDNDSVNEDDAAHMIVRCEQKIRDLEIEMKEDEQLNAAKEVVKDLTTGYSSVIQCEKAKVQFLLAKIEEIQGGDVNPEASV